MSTATTYRPDLGDQLRALFARCESPAEQKFITAFLPLAPQYLKVEAQAEVLRYRVDFLLTGRGRKMVVEVDGRPYHTELAQVVRDHLRNAALLREGYEVTRVWASEIHRNPTRAARRVLKTWRSTK